MMGLETRQWLEKAYYKVLFTALFRGDKVRMHEMQGTQKLAGRGGKAKIHIAFFPSL